MLDREGFRPNVGIILLNANNEVWWGKRVREHSWQFPQGGIDAGENAKEALFRELEEEIGTRDVEIIAEYPQWLEYDFPQKIAQKMYPFDGQSQKYFLVRLGQDAKINLATKEPEFCEFKFVSLNEVFDYITYFKRPVYKQVLDYFKKEGFL